MAANAATATAIPTLRARSGMAIVLSMLPLSVRQGNDADAVVGAALACRGKSFPRDAREVAHQLVGASVEGVACDHEADPAHDRVLGDRPVLDDGAVHGEEQLVTDSRVECAREGAEAVAGAG